MLIRYVFSLKKVRKTGKSLENKVEIEIETLIIIK
jgi:hypothetical protein